MKFSKSARTTTTQPVATPPDVPRLDSLQHRLQHAKDPDGQPIPLIDELLFLLDDPPPGTRDRWEDGADMCRKHGITTSRMSVWRFYRAHILQWRREQNPLPPPPTDPEEIERLHDQARQLCAQRVIEFLNDPNLSPGHLIGFLQVENERQKNQLARDQFDDRLDVRIRLEHQQRMKRIDDENRDKHLMKAGSKLFQDILVKSAAIPPHPTP
jgi:hypothetical protein